MGSLGGGEAWEPRAAQKAALRARGLVLPGMHCIQGSVTSPTAVGCLWPCPGPYMGEMPRPPGMWVPGRGEADKQRRAPGAGMGEGQGRGREPSQGPLGSRLG